MGIIDRIRHREEARLPAVSKERLEALMSSIDFESTMARLGIEVKHVGGGEYVGYCPDHEMYRGVAPSDPKWYINSRTGLTYCQTESRGSNIVTVAKHIWERSTGRKYTSEQVYDMLLDGNAVEIRFTPVRESVHRERTEEEKEKLARSLERVRPVLEDGHVNRQTEAYFAKTGITRDTLEKFGVASYGDRAIVPFLDRNLELCGYIAIDTIGKDAWARKMAEQQIRTEGNGDIGSLAEEYLKKYRKTLYSPGFAGRFHMYGFYENLSFVKESHDRLVLVEGERDCMKLMQEGVPCLSCHGTSVKEEQLLLLKTSGVLGNLRELYLGFDMDEAGNRAVEKAMAQFSQEMDYDRIYVLRFPENKDPKWFSRGELEHFMEYSRENAIRSR